MKERKNSNVLFVAGVLVKVHTSTSIFHNFITELGNMNVPLAEPSLQQKVIWIFTYSQVSNKRTQKIVSNKRTSWNFEEKE